MSTTTKTISIAVIDFETTGLDTATCEVIEAAVTFATAGEHLAYESTASDLFCPKTKLPKKVEELTGITASMLVGRHPAGSAVFRVATMLAGWEGNARAELLVAHNAAYDRAIYERGVNDGRQWLCTMRLARRVLPEADNHKLGDLLFSLGLPDGTTCERVRGAMQGDTAHRAGYDTLSTLVLLGSLLARLPEHVCPSGATMRERALAAAAWLDENYYHETWPMGRHRGEPTQAVPTSYLRWAAANIDDPDVALTAVEELAMRGEVAV